VEDGIEHTVGEELHFLGFAHGRFAIVLNGAEIVHGCTAGEEALGEYVGGGDCILHGDVDTDAADRGHGVGCVSDAEETGATPLLKAVDLYGEEFHFVPGVDFGGAPGEKWDDAFDALMECRDAFLLDLREGAFGDDVSDLKVVVAVDEDDEAAVVDVSEGVLGVVGLAGHAEPEDVDGNAVVYETQMGGVARDGVAAIAADSERRWDLGGAVWSVGEDAFDGAVFFPEEAGCLPTHAQGEAVEAGGFGGEEVEEVPLGHERDKSCVTADVGEVRHGYASISDKAGKTRDLSMGDAEEFFEEAKFVEQLEC